MGTSPLMTLQRNCGEQISVAWSILLTCFHPVALVTPVCLETHCYGQPRGENRQRPYVVENGSDRMSEFTG